MCGIVGTIRANGPVDEQRLGDKALREELASNGRTSVLESYTNEAVALKLAGALEMAVSGKAHIFTSETESVLGKIVTVVQPDVT